ncbi:MAG: polysaccharide deacetylase family protein [Bdellovibrionota bacterium]
MSTKRPIASLSLDLDNKWSYLKIHGEESWKEHPTYLPLAIPRILEILAEEDLKITFFVVGQDAADPRNQPVLKAIADAGHEIGNHSYDHESWLHLHSEAEIRDELLRAHQTIESVTGFSPKGFRGPGFSVSETVLKVVRELGYDYDCSTWPTFIGPLARAYYMRTGEFSEEQHEDRAQLFGKFSEGFRPLGAYRFTGAARGLIEVPVSTLPVFRLPVHISYLLYLRGVSEGLSNLYFQAAMQWFRLFRTPPSLLLHTLDFLGGDDERDLGFFPAMNVSGAEKVRFVRGILRALKRQFDVVPMGEHVQHVIRQPLKSITPKFDDSEAPSRQANDSSGQPLRHQA